MHGISFCLLTLVVIVASGTLVAAGPSDAARNQLFNNQNSFNQNGKNQNGMNQNAFNQNGKNQNGMSQNAFNQNAFSQNAKNQNPVNVNPTNQNVNNKNDRDKIDSKPASGPKIEIKVKVPGFPKPPEPVYTQPILQPNFPLQHPQAPFPTSGVMVMPLLPAQNSGHYRQRNSAGSVLKASPLFYSLVLLVSSTCFLYLV